MVGFRKNLTGVFLLNKMFNEYTCDEYY